MGFGHRVYKNYDPRAAVIRTACHDVLDALGKRNEPLLELAMELERVALEDDYFISHKLFPNVDFYSGIILQAIGFPTSMFTVLFAVARTVGWVAQWKEMIEDPTQRIGRPAPALHRLRRNVPTWQSTSASKRSGPQGPPALHYLKPALLWSSEGFDHRRSMLRTFHSGSIEYFIDQDRHLVFARWEGDVRGD